MDQKMIGEEVLEPMISCRTVPLSFAPIVELYKIIILLNKKIYNNYLF